MEQNQLFTESLYMALDDIVRACGGYKKVAGQFWPKVAPESAYARIKNCLNPEKGEKFSLEEIESLLLDGRKAGCHVAAIHLMRFAGYEDPVVAPPKSPRRMLLERKRELIGEMLALDEQLEAIDTEDQIKAVS